MFSVEQVMGEDHVIMRVTSCGRRNECTHDAIDARHRSNGFRSVDFFHRVRGGEAVMSKELDASSHNG